MSYIQTVKIMDNVSTTWLENPDNDIYASIINNIKSVTNWKTFEGTNTFQIGNFNQLNLNFSWQTGTGHPYLYYYIKSSSKNYYPDTTNPSSDVEQSIFGKHFSTSINSDISIYLHYCKSKSGKTVGIGIGTSTTPKIDFVIAEDANGDFAGIGLSCNRNLGDSIFFAKMICKGNTCHFNNAKANNSNYNDGGYLGYIMSATKTISTSVCKMPNFLSGCMFNEVYMILSCPLSPTSLVNTVLDINGKKYQGFCNQFETNNELHANSLSILAG